MRAVCETFDAPSQSFHIVNMVLTRGDWALANALAALPEVTQVIENESFMGEKPVDQIDDIRSEEPAERTTTTIEWGLTKIKADLVWAQGYRGNGIVVAGADTGYKWDSPSLKRSYRGWNGATADHDYNWHDAIHALINGGTNSCGLNLPVPCDDNNHGTHTMGTMVGDDGLGNQIGIAPDARWMACRNMERGNGRPSTYIECFQFFLAPTDLAGQNADPLAAPHVINNSWYCSKSEGCDSSFSLRIMEKVIENLQKAGIFVVVSNGNFGPNCETTTGPPALFESSFCVGATRSDDSIATFSSRGPGNFGGQMFIKPNVSAPGQGVRSCIRNGEFAHFSGTSMAGPHVAGLIALIISANPELAGRVGEISKIIEATAVRKFSEQDCGGVSSANFPNNVYGWGRIDALAAVKMARGLAKIESGVRLINRQFANDLEVEITNVVGEISLRFFDVCGRLISVKTIEADRSFSTFYRIDGLRSGLYFYQISWPGGQASGKLIHPY